MAITRQSIWKAALLFGASTGLSGCVYDIGLGFASDGYYDDGYGCDPYGGYDAYYNCDYGHGFSNIGFGGGWYDNYYYPGHGIFLFDTFGRRHPMREQYRRYWGEKRHVWYRENRRRDGDGGRYQGRNRGYTDGGTLGVIAWPERHGGRVDDVQRPRDGRREGRRGRNDQWRGADGRGAGGVPSPNTGAPPGQGRGSEHGGADRQPNRPGGGALDRHTVPAPPREVLPTRQNAMSAEKPPAPRPGPQGPQPPRQRMPEGGVERPD